MKQLMNLPPEVSTRRGCHTKSRRSGLKSIWNSSWIYRPEIAIQNLEAHKFTARSYHLKSQQSRLESKWKCLNKKSSFSLAAISSPDWQYPAQSVNFRSRTAISGPERQFPAQSGHFRPVVALFCRKRKIVSLIIDETYSAKRVKYNLIVAKFNVLCFYFESPELHENI